jgi:hypothetical protein
MAPHAYHRIGRAEFERRHGLDFQQLCRELNRLWRAYAGLVK